MLFVEIAENQRDLERGLMFRKELANDSGMLFKFQSPQVMNFWGSNTYIPLDIAFVDSDNTIVKIGKIQPFDLRSVSSDTDCVIAIEANEGFFESNGIGIGHKINVEKTAHGQNFFTVLFKE